MNYNAIAGEFEVMSPTSALLGICVKTLPHHPDGEPPPVSEVCNSVTQRDWIDWSCFVDGKEM